MKLGLCYASSSLLAPKRQVQSREKDATIKISAASSPANVAALALKLLLTEQKQTICTYVYLIVQSLHDLAHNFSINPLKLRSEVRKLSSLFFHILNVRNKVLPFLTRTCVKQPPSSHLLGLPKLFQDLECHLVVAEQVVGHGEPDPGGALRRAELEQLVPGVLWGGWGGRDERMQ